METLGTECGIKRLVRFFGRRPYGVAWPDCAAEDKASRYKILQIPYALFYQDVVMKHASIQIVFIVLGEKRKTWSCNHFNIVSTLARARITDGYYSGNMDAVLTDHVRE